MIYLANNTNFQQITLPVVENISIVGIGLVKFLLFSSVNRKNEIEHSLTQGDFNNDYNADFAVVAEPLFSESGQFYKFTFGFDAVPPIGEYEYTLIAQNGSVLGRGIAIVGNYHTTHTEYGNTKEYKQYGV